MLKIPSFNSNFTKMVADVIGGANRFVRPQLQAQVTENRHVAVANPVARDALKNQGGYIERPKHAVYYDKLVNEQVAAEVSALGTPQKFAAKDYQNRVNAIKAKLEQGPTYVRGGNNASYFQRLHNLDVQRYIRRFESSYTDTTVAQKIALLEVHKRERPPIDPNAKNGGWFSDAGYLRLLTTAKVHALIPHD